MPALEPSRQTVQVGGEALELAHGLSLPIRRDGDKMRGCADVDPGGMGIEGRKRGLGVFGFACHWVFLHNPVESAWARGCVKRLSLKRDGYASPSDAVANLQATLTNGYANTIGGPASGPRRFRFSRDWGRGQELLPDAWGSTRT